MSQPPLDPSPDEARGLLERELVRPEYHRHDVLGQVLDWLDRFVSGTVDAASGSPPLSAFAAMVAFLLLALGLGCVTVVNRVRRALKGGSANG